jgi:hypothetical protein
MYNILTYTRSKHHSGWIPDNSPKWIHDGEAYFTITSEGRLAQTIQELGNNKIICLNCSVCQQMPRPHNLVLKLVISCIDDAEAYFSIASEGTLAQRVKELGNSKIICLTYSPSQQTPCPPLLGLKSSRRKFRS